MKVRKNQVKEKEGDESEKEPKVKEKGDDESEKEPDLNEVNGVKDNADTALSNTKSLKAILEKPPGEAKLQLTARKIDQLLLPVMCGKTKVCHVWLELKRPVPRE